MDYEDAIYSCFSASDCDYCDHRMKMTYPAIDPLGSEITLQWKAMESVSLYVPCIAISPCPLFVSILTYFRIGNFYQLNYISAFLVFG